jgi:hypothetical protein
VLFATSASDSSRIVLFATSASDSGSIGAANAGGFGMAHVTGISLAQGLSVSAKEASTGYSESWSLTSNIICATERDL